MAVSKGTVNTSDYQGRYVKCDWQIVEQYIGNNGKPYSDIKITLTGAGEATSTWYMAGNFRVYVYDNDTGERLNFVTFYGSERIQLYNGTVIGSIGALQVAHNETTGKLNARIEVSAAIYDFSTNRTGEGVFEFPTIPPYAAPRVASEVTINGGQYIVSILGFDSSCTYDLTFDIPSVASFPETTIATGLTVSSTRWIVPTSVYQYIPNRSSVPAVVYCKTYYNGSLLGTQTANTTIIVAQRYNSPTIDSINITLNSRDTKTQALTGSANKFILNCSLVDYSVTATAKNSATIAATNIKNAGTILYGPTGSFVQPITSSQFIATVTDSRGFMVADDLTVDAVDYIPMTMTAEVGEPSGSSVVLSVSGNLWTGNFGASSNAYGIDYTLQYRTSQGAAWRSAGTGHMTVDVNTSDHTYSGSVTLSDLDYNYEYRVRVAAQDQIEYINSEWLSIAFSTVFDWSQTDFNFNVPVAMQDELEVAGNITAGGNIDIGGDIVKDGATLPIPVVTEWNPTIVVRSGSGGNVDVTIAYNTQIGRAVKLGDMCILSWYVEGTLNLGSTAAITAAKSKIGITHQDPTTKIWGLPYTPDSTRWWAGGGNAAGYTLSTDGTAFNGWCIEDNSGWKTICGRAGAIRSGESTTTAKSSSYIGIDKDTPFYFSGTIMYKIA